MKSRLEQLREILAQIENKPGFEENVELTRELIRKQELSDILDNTIRIAREMGKGCLVETDLRRLKKEVWAIDEAEADNED